MKVLLHNRAHGLWNGGDATVVAELEAHLRFAGVDATYISNPSDVGEYDIVHLHNISMPWTWELFCRARPTGARFVVSTIYEPGVFQLVTADEQRRIAREALAIVCYSSSEARTVVEDLRADSTKIHVVRLGVSPAFAKGEVWLPGPYVLEVGRVEPRKNQLALVSAVREKPVVLAGDVFDYSYYQRVLRASAGNVLHLSMLSRDRVCGLYAGARVCCLPTTFELCGLVNLEALVAGCHVVTTDTGGTREYCGDLATYVDPGDPAALSAVIDRLWTSPRENRAEDVLRRYSWSRFAAEHHAIYERVGRGAG